MSRKSKRQFADIYIGPYGMFSKAGDNAVDKMLKRMVCFSIADMTDKVFLTKLQVEVKKIQRKHGEVRDTVVRENIANYIEQEAHRSLSIFDF
jgi:hypothetical protein